MKELPRPRKSLKRSLLRDQTGLAMSMVILVMLLSATLGAASLVASSLDVQSTGHYVTGNQAMYAAESGILHALATINQAGVIDFEADVADRWASRFGTEARTFPATSQVTYNVQVLADPDDPADSGAVRVTGTAPLQASRTVRIDLRKDGFGGSPGAIYLANDDATMDFKGNSFAVDGNDYGADGTLSGGPQKPGISARNGAVVDQVTEALSDIQKDNVRGEGFSLAPLAPSVRNTGGPTTSDVDQFVEDILAPLEVNLGQFKKTLKANGDLYENGSGLKYFKSALTSFGGNNTFGSIDSPQVTHITADQTRFTGNASGAGVLIVDGTLVLSGTFDFTGWVLVRGQTIVNQDVYSSDFGDAKVLGTLWTSELQLDLGGNIEVKYCDACLRAIDGISPVLTNAVPRPMRIVSWQELGS